MRVASSTRFKSAQPGRQRSTASDGDMEQRRQAPCQWHSPHDLWPPCERIAARSHRVCSGGVAAGGMWRGDRTQRPGSWSGSSGACGGVHTAWDSGTQQGRTTRRASQSATGDFGLRTIGDQVVQCGATHSQVRRCAGDVAVSTNSKAFFVEST
jgi:hypothetical protein